MGWMGQRSGWDPSNDDDDGPNRLDMCIQKVKLFVTCCISKSCGPLPCNPTKLQVHFNESDKSRFDSGFRL